MILTTLNATTLIVGKVISLFLIGLVQILVFTTPVLVAYLFFRDQLALPSLDLSGLQLQPGPMITGALLLFGGFLLSLEPSSPPERSCPPPKKLGPSSGP